nr:MAG: capsid protein [Cressdnaviricota sp.]
MVNAMASGSQRAQNRYWSVRRGQQWKRFGGRLATAYDKPSVSSVASAAWSGVKYLRTLVNSEVMKIDFAAAGGSVSTTASIIHITAIAQGDGVAARTGNSIMLKYISFKGRFVSSAASTASILRVMMFIDKQQVSDTSPSVSDVLEATTDPQSHLSVANTGRIQVLFDKTYQFDNLSRRAFFVKLQKGMKQHHVRYNGTTTSDVQKGGVYLLFLSSEGVNTVSVDYRCRVAYHDN